MTNDNEQLSVDDLRLKTSEDGPVLKIGDDMSVLLRTFVEVDDEMHFESGAERLKTDVDMDGDNGAWWNIWPGDELHPLISIQPEVIHDE